MRQELSLNLMDTHAGGDVSRIVLGGIDPLPGKTVRQQMEYLRDDADGLRRRWVERMTWGVLSLAWRYNAHRMVIDYLRTSYLPAAGATVI